jgi:hypothetical protein
MLAVFVRFFFFFFPFPFLFLLSPEKVYHQRGTFQVRLDERESGPGNTDDIVTSFLLSMGLSRLSK